MSEIVKNITILYPIFLVLYFALCFSVQAFVKKHQDKKIQKKSAKYDTKRDVKNSVITLFFASTFLSIGIYLKQLGFGIDYKITNYHVLNFVLEFLIGLFVFDTAFYWGHRLVHSNKKLFKVAHLLHHKNNAPDVWGSYNETIEDTLLLQSFFLYAIFIIPISVPALIAVNIYTLFLDVVGHCGYDIAPRVPLTQFTTVADHDLHHRHYNCNYAPYFTIWDKLMGTYKSPDNLI